VGQISNSKDLLVLLFYAKGKTGQVCEPIIGRTRLMKMVFLFEKEIRHKLNLDKVIPEEVLPDFVAYDYGPFSEQVYNDLEFLVNMEFVNVTSLDDELLPDEEEEYGYWQAISDNEDKPFREQFSLSPLGKKFVEEKLKSKLSDNQWNVLNEFKKRCTSTSLRYLLKYVYTRYPDKTKKSKIRDQLLGT
jgi:uncharacterized protein YwgA